MINISRYWYSKNILVLLLLPLSWLFIALIKMRKLAYSSGILKVHRFDVPVIVVGNITVGGTGKTPLVIWLVATLKKSGFNPGIVLRGYKGNAQYWPQQVRHDSDPGAVGDEAVMLARRCSCPIAVSPNRVEAVKELIKFKHCDVIVSDDGLQHLALGRDIEIAVVDGVRRYGNGFCLPTGPLREPVSRLKNVDFVVVNGGSLLRREYSMTVHPGVLRNVKNPSIERSLESFKSSKVNAIAAIGNPQKFFDTLESHGINIVKHEFDDHHSFISDDLSFELSLPIIMTEKDAVKCGRISNENSWFLVIDIEPDKKMQQRMLICIDQLSRKYRS